jgi:Ubiquitin family
MMLKLLDPPSHTFDVLLKTLLVATTIVCLVVSKTPVPNVQVTLRGKKYDLEDITTVAELQDRLSEVSGVEPSQQGRVLFNGKRLAASECLSEAGVVEGDQLNIVPGKTKSKSKTSAPVGDISPSPSDEVPSASAMQDMLNGSGIDTSKLDDLMKKMGGSDGGVPNLQESMEMMSGMMNSPIFKEYMNDPERLEQSRQMILQNPMLKSMMAGMPGMEDILNSPEAWKEAMQAAAAMYQNMDQNDLMKAMMGGAPGAGMDGLFGGEGSMSALDELSEGEE